MKKEIALLFTEHEGKCRGLTGSTLKMIAMTAMLIDHIGAAVLARILLSAGMNETIYRAYTICRLIGRISFPIFCFLLVEGFSHTSNPKKYAVRLLAFAILSEIPFDLAFFDKILEFEHQNVFFTLAIGFVTMMGYKKIEEQTFDNQLVRVLLLILLSAAGAGAAELLRTDYGMFGVLVILVFYMTRANRLQQTIYGMLLFFKNITAWFAFLPICAYNGKRGLNLKWIFYVFYPGHLLILYGISCLLSLGSG